jgi:MtN3 and saliva related transmembrane protein
VVGVLAVAAAAWGVIMAVAPLLQTGRMLQRRSSADVSIGYLMVLLPGFLLWVAYGVASSNPALIVPNATAAVIGAVTLAVAVRFRVRPGPDARIESTG